MHIVITAEQVMANRNHVMKCAGRCEEHYSDEQRENDRSVI